MKGSSSIMTKESSSDIVLFPAISKFLTWRKKASRYIRNEIFHAKRRHEKEWIKEKKKVLSDASKIFPCDISLDVSKRDGIYIFHNKNNTLIQRGETYEPIAQHTLMTFLFLDKLRGKSTVFADLGANIGLHTFFLKSQCKKLDIIAFEPSPSCINYLELSIKYNNISGIRLEKIALSDTNGMLDFYNWGEEGSADSLKDTDRVPNATPNIIQVPTKRMDDIEDLPDITVIKMDCEGAEIPILKGAKQTLSKNRPFILLEFHPKNKAAFGITTEDIFNFLSESEYSLYSENFEKIDSNTFEILQQAVIESYIMLPNEFLRP